MCTFTDVQKITFEGVFIDHKMARGLNCTLCRILQLKGSFLYYCNDFGVVCEPTSGVVVIFKGEIINLRYIMRYASKAL